jgi:hypothetical protein
MQDLLEKGKVSLKGWTWKPNLCLDTITRHELSTLLVVTGAIIVLMPLAIYPVHIFEFLFQTLSDTSHTSALGGIR